MALELPTEGPNWLSSWAFTQGWVHNARPRPAAVKAEILVCIGADDPLVPARAEDGIRAGDA